MIRITELRLPLDHPPSALKAAAAQRLRLPEDALASLHVHKRSHDARKKQALTFIYSVDLELVGGLGVWLEAGSQQVPFNLHVTGEIRTCSRLREDRANPSVRCSSAMSTSAVAMLIRNSFWSS